MHFQTKKICILHSHSVFYIYKTDAENRLLFLLGYLNITFCKQQDSLFDREFSEHA